MSDKKVDNTKVEVGKYHRNHGILVAIEEIPPEPVPPQLDFIFEEVAARCEIHLNGECLKVVQVLNDFYGEGAAVEEAIKEMKVYAKAKGIGLDSELEVVVIREATQYRKRRSRVHDDDHYLGFSYLEVGRRRGLPAPDERIVWSSKTGLANNE